MHRSEPVLKAVQSFRSPAKEQMFGLSLLSFCKKKWQHVGVVRKVIYYVFHI